MYYHWMSKLSDNTINWWKGICIKNIIVSQRKTRFVSINNENEDLFASHNKNSIIIHACHQNQIILTFNKHVTSIQDCQ